jgi:hypothetical protein
MDKINPQDINSVNSQMETARQTPTLSNNMQSNTPQNFGASFYRTSVAQCYQAGYGYNLGTATGAGVDQKNDRLSQPPSWTVVRTAPGTFVVTHNLGTLAYYPAVSCSQPFTVTTVTANSFTVNIFGVDTIFSYIVFCTP